MTWFDWAEKHLAKWKVPEAGQAENAGNFTPRAVQVLSLARKEADQLNHNFLGTEHILLGIIKLNQGVSVIVLRKMGVNLEELRLEVKKRAYGASPIHVPYAIPYTPRTKKVIAQAQKQARSLCHYYVGTEHLLLGLLAEGEGFAAQALKHFNLDLERMRKEILIEPDPNFSPPDNSQSKQE